MNRLMNWLKGRLLMRDDISTSLSWLVLCPNWQETQPKISREIKYHLVREGNWLSQLGHKERSG